MKVPTHVGIIMDGNGRWARAKGMVRTLGHQEGLKSAKRIVKAARDAGVQYLSLYAFSTENWNRSTEEVSFLMNLIKTSLRKEYEFYRKNGIRVLHSGDLEMLLPEIRKEITDVEADTSHYSDLTVNLAINHGGRNEIARAVQSAVCDGVDPQTISQDDIARYLDQPELPDLDLVIRSGGEQRLSNFMLWQASYAELYFSSTLWPDFSPEEFQRILCWYGDRERKFGRVGKNSEAAAVAI